MRCGTVEELVSGVRELDGAEATGVLVSWPRLNAANIKAMAHTSAPALSLLFMGISSPGIGCEEAVGRTAEARYRPRFGPSCHAAGPTHPFGYISTSFDT